MKAMPDTTQTIVFGGGCFWCTEAVFGELKGVQSVMPGYAGVPKAEVVKVEFDPILISAHDLLTVFFATHDPTSVNRQGADVGPQYRSAIFYTTEPQRAEAEKFITDLDAVTELKPLSDFQRAEEYHREYYKNNPSAPYCQLVINPKLEKVQKEFHDLLKLQK